MTKDGSSEEKPDVDALKKDIEQTRAELGETVQALAAKADVKARAKDSVEQTKQRVKAQAVQAGEKVRDAALHASEKVKESATHAGDKAQGAKAAAADKVHETAVQVRQSETFGKAQDSALEASERVKRNPVPVAAVLAAGAALAIVLFIIRGRRR